MIFAIFGVTNNEFRVNHNINEIRRLFSTGNVKMIRWGFVGTSSDIYGSENGNLKYNSIIRLQIENRRIKPFATDKEIEEYFYSVLNNKTVSEHYTSNQFNQGTDTITFVPTLL